MCTSASEIKIGILTVSDRCYNGVTRDVSGEFLESAINEKGVIPNGKVVIRMCVPDEFDQIQSVLKKWSDLECLNVIITTGGTGLSERDVTPEVTKSIIEKEAFSLSFGLLYHSLKITPMAMLSRPVCGIRKRTLIVNLPGSWKACSECLEVLKDIIPHAVVIITDDTEHIESAHQKIQGCIKNLHITEAEVTPLVRSKCVADRCRVSPFPMTSVKDAQKMILNQIQVKEKLNLPLRKCLGYYLFSDVWSDQPLPPFAASVKDGYAVKASDGTGTRRVVSSCLAGSKPSECTLIKEGECARISTGAPLPFGADAVVQVEDTKLISSSVDGNEENEVEILKAPTVGQDIREIGCDLKAGTLVLTAGTFVTYAELGVLATIGASQVSVFKKPTVCVFSTGNEIQNPEDPVQEGKIRDCNRISLIALLAENGYPSIDGGIIPDDADVTLSKIKEILEECDVIITSGSASMGERDILISVLAEQLGVVVHFGRVNMKPGKPTKFATVTYLGKRKYFFVLPGNPVSAVVTCTLFVLPALNALSGSPTPLSNLIKVKLSCDVALDERPDFQRAELRWECDGNGIPTAIPTGKQASSRILSMLKANCLLHLPARSKAVHYLPAGYTITAQVIGKL